jgi:hypothetical protein
MPLKIRAFLSSPFIAPKPTREPKIGKENIFCESPESRVSPDEPDK